MTSKIDKTDRKILNALQQDASMSMDTLSQIVTLSRNACWRRVKQMEDDGIITGRVVLIDPEAVDLGLSVFVMIKTNAHEPEWLQKFERAIKDTPEIVGAHRMSGDLDYILRVRVSDVKGYDRFYQRLISKVPIAEISASFVMDNIKDTAALPII